MSANEPILDGRCPTACDPDCNADCHETHDVEAKQQHQPEECPGHQRQPISPERLAEIRRECGPRSVYLSGVAGDGLVVMANQLLDEIDRLAEVLRANSVVRNAAESSCRVYKATFEKVRRERDEERAEVKRLRAVIVEEHGRFSQDPEREAELKQQAETAARELAEAHAALAVAAELIDRFAVDGPCRLDHHGECLAHGLPDAPCPYPLGRQFVEAWHAVEAEEQKAADDAHQ